MLFGNGFGTATFKRDTVNATGMAGARFDLYRNDHVAVAAFGGLRYGAVLGSWEDDPAWRLSGGLALHVAPGDIWAMDVTTNLLSVPLFDEDAPTQTAVDLFWHTQIVQSWQLTETSQLRVGIEPLPYVAIRKRIAKRVWVEPAVGALMTAVKLEAVL
ncbi:MAG: hypothetical protein H6734_25890 [Alphaproteobacteria bacterium]|nr:hypothetical protein [Alphaproteobacteria bacterium]